MTPLLSTSPPQAWLLLLVWAQRRLKPQISNQWLRAFSFCDQNVGCASLCLAFRTVLPDFQHPPDHPKIQTIPCNNPHYTRNVFSPPRKTWIFSDTGIQLAITIVSIQFVTPYDFSQAFSFLAKVKYSTYILVLHLIL